MQNTASSASPDRGPAKPPRQVRALVINELTSPAWTEPGAALGDTVGTEMLKAFEFETERWAFRI
jgi:hypothetical protein